MSVPECFKELLVAQKFGKYAENASEQFRAFLSTLLGGSSEAGRGGPTEPWTNPHPLIKPIPKLPALRKVLALLPVLDAGGQIGDLTPNLPPAVREAAPLAPFASIVVRVRGPKHTELLLNRSGRLAAALSRRNIWWVARWTRRGLPRPALRS